MLELNGKTYQVPEWIVRKNLNQLEATAWKTASGYSVQRETEKAVLVEADTDYGFITMWCPKSVLVSTEEVELQREASDERWKNNCRYSNYLKALAADNGVKLGNMSSWEKIIAKLEKHGVKAMSRQEFAA